MILPALIYIVWDIYFTRWGVWSFNENYIAGIYLFNLPVEEVLFFIVVPYCCLFIYECIICYFPGIKEGKWWNIIFYLLAFTCLIVGTIFYQQKYTAATFIALGSMITILLRARSFFNGFDIAAFLVSYLVILVPFMIVNGFLTAIPVVLYNDAENLGFRIYTIPFEDIFYGMLLILMNVLIYEKLRSKHQTRLAASSSRNQ